VGTAFVVALAGIGVYAMTRHGRTTSPRAHYVRRHLRQGKPVRAHMRGVGKPSLVFLTVIVSMIIATVVVRASL
jgi:hypothetical protein